MSAPPDTSFLSLMSNYTQALNWTSDYNKALRIPVSDYAEAQLFPASILPVPLQQSPFSPLSLPTQQILTLSPAAQLTTPLYLPLQPITAHQHLIHTHSPHPVPNPPQSLSLN